MTIYQRVVECASRYTRAQAEHNTCDMMTVQALLAARVGLLTCLVDAGWTPPAHTAAALEYDRAVLRLVPGSRLENWPATDPRTPAPASTNGRTITIDQTVTALPQQR